MRDLTARVEKKCYSFPPQPVDRVVQNVAERLKSKENIKKDYWEELEAYAEWLLNSTKSFELRLFLIFTMFERNQNNELICVAGISNNWWNIFNKAKELCLNIHRKVKEKREKF